MAKKAKDKTLEQWLIPQLRGIYRYWPAKNAALDAAKVKVHIGFYKNGNPEYKTMMKCYICEQTYDRSEIQVDHIVPVVDIKTTKIDWNEFVYGLFCDQSNLGVCCKSCHYIKTQAENQERRKHKK